MAQHPSDAHDLDAVFYLPADEFFRRSLPQALTFDDVTLATRFSTVLPRQTDLETTLAPGFSLRLPVISSDMDTVTEAPMAIAMALNGGMGLIHANMTEREQTREVARVKNHVHGLIKDPITVTPQKSIGDVLELIEAKGYSFSTFPVVDEAGYFVGLLPGRVVRPRYASRKVGEAMTPRENVFTITEREIGDEPITAADRFFDEHMGTHKLIVLDDEGRLHGLFTLTDIERIRDEMQAEVKPARDSKFRLRCGATVSAVRTRSGALDRTRMVTHVARLVEEGIDVVAVSTAHGHSEGVGEAVRLLRAEFPELPLIAGNVTSAEGVEYLARAGANVIKVGQGPGSICTTRNVAGVGIPQLTALYVCALAARKAGVTILADGGISKSGDMVKALTLADAVMCGSLLAGCREAPGKIIEIEGKLYKEYRGMGSREAMKAGSAARYGHDHAERIDRKAAAEGIEALKELSGTVDRVLGELTGGVRSGLGYLGARNLAELRERARYIRITPAGQRESSPHDVVEIKTSQERR